MSTCVKSLYNRLNIFSSLLINRPSSISFIGNYSVSSARFDRQHVKFGKKPQKYDYSIIIFHPNRLEYLHPDLYKNLSKPNNELITFELSNKKKTFFRNENQLMTLLDNADTNAGISKNSVLLSSTDDPLKSNKPLTDDIKTRPSDEDLDKVFHILSDCLASFFNCMHPYHIYHENVVFENNIRGTRVVGIGKYAAQVWLAKLLGHVKFAYVDLKILKSTKHPEDGTIRIRWRVQGIGGAKVIYSFWRYKFWKIKKTLEEAPTWVDGFSIFYVGPDGLIHKHVMDKMQPDDDKIVNDKSNITAKLALILGGLVDKEGLIHFFSNPFKMKKKRQSSDSEITLPPSKMHT